MTHIFFSHETSVQIKIAEFSNFKENVINGSAIKPKFKC